MSICQTCWQLDPSDGRGDSDAGEKERPFNEGDWPSQGGENQWQLDE
jgi:hypothetical protein